MAAIIAGNANVDAAAVEKFFKEDTASIADVANLLGSAEAVISLNVAEKICALLNKSGKKDAPSRKAGVVAAESIIEKLGLNVIPALSATLPIILQLVGDKKGAEVREVAEKAMNTIFSKLPAAAVTTFVSDVLVKSALLNTDSRWQTKVLALKLITEAAEKFPREIECLMTQLVPVISKCMWDTRAQVKEQAADTLEDAALSIDNIDLEPFIPSLVEAIAEPQKVPDCVYALAGTTFVQTVTAAALSITVPVLERGFKERTNAIIRKCAVITENLSKLVKDPNDVAPFLPVLLPLLELGVKDIADPECRGRFEAALAVVKRVGDLGSQGANKVLEKAKVAAKVKAVLGKTANEPTVDYVADVATALVNITRSAKEDVWVSNISPLISACSKKAVDDVKAIRDFCVEEGELKEGSGAGGNGALEEDVDDDGSEDLCDLTFSLAYGSNILLNSARLHLKKGKKYGIIANKSAGKTSMMRAISNNQVEGFPSPQEVRTIFIENDIQGSQLNMRVVEYLCDSISFGIKLSEEEALTALKDGGFTDVMCNGLITQLSGGWKMKLALIRATLEKAQIMLMDEPTNHLDVINVQWVVDYINSLPDVTCLIVSHDTHFMDKTVSHIIHFEDLKLHTYKGNVSAFVERFPEAASYFSLSSTKMRFKFPTPGMLEGVNNKGTAILSMTDVDFTYPGAPKPQLTGVTIKASMASRVAIVGANGAGKSTMIKLLTGELKPSKGNVRKHPNCRFAYVAQHAFHHIEQHLEKSPNEYIRWRFDGGDDKEARVKSTAVITPEEKKLMEKPFEVVLKDEETGATRKEKRVLEKLMSRRKVKKEMHYEVKWKGKSMDQNSYYSREFLMKRGFKKMIDALDRRLAAATVFSKPLTSRNVEEHLANVGLETEYATHCRIKDLSGGQKVKVVLAACTWPCPHLIILDEPTNYLDRDSLGALANAIEDFDGGVVLITHNKEFAEHTTKVTWVVANNKVDIKGDAEWEKYAAEQEVLAAEAADVDAFGNKIVKKDIIKPFEELTKSEVKKWKKKLQKKIKRGEELEEWEMDYCDEMDVKYD